MIYAILPPHYAKFKNHGFLGTTEYTEYTERDDALQGLTPPLHPAKAVVGPHPRALYPTLLKKGFAGIYFENEVLQFHRATSN